MRFDPAQPWGECHRITGSIPDETIVELMIVAATGNLPAGVSYEIFKSDGEQVIDHDVTTGEPIMGMVIGWRYPRMMDDARFVPVTRVQIV